MTRSERIFWPTVLEAGSFVLSVAFVWLVIDMVKQNPFAPWSVRFFAAVVVVTNAFIAAHSLFVIPYRIKLGLKLRRIKADARAHLIEEHGPEEGERRFRLYEFEREGENG